MKKYTPHFVTIAIFLITSYVIFSPVIQGKVLFQSDIQQYRGMSRQIEEVKQNEERQLYWIDNAYIGMPTYQLGAKYPYDVLTPIHKIIRILPFPIFQVFLYFLGVYILLTTLRLPIRYSILGALVFGLSTYLLIILQVGHNTKAQAIGYMPFVLTGVYLIFQKRYALGFFLSLLFFGLQVRANHYQMSYYMLLLILLFIGVEVWNHIKLKIDKSIYKKISVLAIAFIIGLGLNATALLSTLEYSKFSTRGKSELTKTVDGRINNPSSGLSHDYITQYSYGLFESLNLIVPRIQGGGSSESLSTDSGLYKFLIKKGVPENQAKGFIANTPTYWGDQPILEAPAYIGIGVFFLALLSVFLSRSKIKNWLILGTVLSLVLSWGKNFNLLTSLFIDYFPLYNKFRAVTSIQIILEFCLPVLAMLGLYEFFSQKNEDKLKALKKAFFSVIGLFFLLFLFKGSLSFQGTNDAYFTQLFGAEIVSQIVVERKAIFDSDLIRSGIFVLIISIFLFLYYKNKLTKNFAFIGIAALLVIDLFQISNRYLDDNRFVSPSEIREAFNPTVADRAILQDSTNYRVYEPEVGLSNARTAYFHKAVGGYHGAKPRRFEELIELMESEKRKDILDILNVKYIIYQDENEQAKPFINPSNLGNAWFINEVIVTPTVDETFQLMNEIDFKQTAVSSMASLQEIPQSYSQDSLAYIELEENKIDYLKYRSKNEEDGFALFSEMYYPFGWVATIDGEPAPIYQMDYILRGLSIPKGSHIIEFQFQPQVIKWGNSIQLSCIIITLGLFGFSIKKKLFQKENQT